MLRAQGFTFKPRGGVVSSGPRFLQLGSMGASCSSQVLINLPGIITGRAQQTQSQIRVEGEGVECSVWGSYRSLEPSGILHIPQGWTGHKLPPVDAVHFNEVVLLGACRKDGHAGGIRDVDEKRSVIRVIRNDVVHQASLCPFRHAARGTRCLGKWVSGGTGIV